jgi:hypothetical protein
MGVAVAGVADRDHVRGCVLAAFGDRDKMVNLEAVVASTAVDAAPAIAL